MKFKLFIPVFLLGLLPFLLPYFWAYGIFGKENFNQQQYFLKIIEVHGLSLVLALLFVGYLTKKNNEKFWETLGFRSHFLIPFGVGFLASLPMLMGYGYSYGLNHNIEGQDLFIKSVWAGFFEEVFFRGFIFGMLVFYAQWKFIWAALLSGVIFAWGHLYQAENQWEMITIFITVTLINFGFCYFYKLWNWNLWFVISLHLFMDLSAVLFIPSGSVLMNGNQNLFRILAIVLAIGLSLLLNRKKGQPTS